MIFHLKLYIIVRSTQRILFAFRDTFYYIIYEFLFTYLIR